MLVKKLVKSIQFLNLWPIGIKFSNCERPQNRIAYILRSIGKETSKKFLTTAEQKQQATKNQVCSTRIFQRRKTYSSRKIEFINQCRRLDENKRQNDKVEILIICTKASNCFEFKKYHVTVLSLRMKHLEKIK